MSRKMAVVGMGIILVGLALAPNVQESNSAKDNTKDIENSNKVKFTEADKKKMIENFRLQNPKYNDADIQITFDNHGTPHIVLKDIKNESKK